MSRPASGPPIDPDELAELLLNAASVGRFEAELEQVRARLEPGWDDIDPIDRFRLQVLFFDLAMVSTSDADVQQQSAARLLTEALGAGGGAWTALLEPGRRAEVERLALIDSAELELLELLAYAPNEGLRGFAIFQLLSAGMSALGSDEDPRSLERLLHGVGATEEAYRLESARKLSPAPTNVVAAPGRDDESIASLRVLAIAGGHAQLRQTAASVLSRHGIRVVSIPSSQEAVRRERDIVGLLNGCDLAMLLVRQITHGTSDQVRKAADRIGVPVMYSNALSAVAIERQLFGPK